MCVWIDLDNSPHVHFFFPIIKRLEQEGMEVVVTVRSFAQTEELAHWYGLEFATIGEHRTPRSTLGRVTATLRRSAQLASHIRARKPAVAISHGSRALAVASWALGISVMTLYDYEFVSSSLFNRVSRRVLVPSVIPTDRLEAQGLNAQKLVPYPGLKEEVYVYDFQPNQTILERLGLDPSRLIVTVRPPATWAHYHDHKSEILFRALVKRLRMERDAQVVVLSRTQRQAADLIRCFAMEGDPFRVLAHAVDGLSLMWFSDTVFSGGGTMAREAALLGVDAYSTLAAKIGAADEALSRQGKLRMLSEVADVEQLTLRKRTPGSLPPNASRVTRDFILNQIVRFARESQ